MAQALHLLALLAFSASLSAQHALLLHRGDSVPVSVPGASTRGLIEKVLAGPTSAERARGLHSAVPSGTRLLAFSVGGGRVSITLSQSFLQLTRSGDPLEYALEQINKTVFQNDPRVHAVDILCEDRDGTIRDLGLILRQAQPALTAPTGTASASTATHPGFRSPLGASSQGALSGKRIVISPGHGFYWHTSLGWTTQRGNIGGLIEDIHCNEIAMRYLIPYLEDMGAQVISCRERWEIESERLVDNDAGFPLYSEFGSWVTSGSSGYQGGTYRYGFSNSLPTNVATWKVPVTHDGTHPVYAWYRAGSNRVVDAHYRIHHSGGVARVEINQQRDGSTWVFLGRFHFTKANGARVELSNVSAVPGKVVIADTIKVGAGMGSISRGAGTSGKARWKECSRYWAQYAGAPASVYNTSTGDNSDDVTTRPRYAEWRGADAYLSLHTNAGGGKGTSSFIYNGGATAGSSTLQQRVHAQVIADLRAGYNAGWTDRGRKQANFGEVRVLSTMPGVLFELAFHDTAGSLDHEALHDPEFRQIAGRALARGMLRYFAPGAPFAPDAPAALRVSQDGQGGLRVAWDARAAATSYTVEQSIDGKGFSEVAQVSGTSWSTGALDHGTVLSFRVRAWNSSGRSQASEVLSAGTSHRGIADLLLVQGFDRREKTVKYWDNRYDYLPRHAQAIADQGEFSLGFDAATNDAVRLGRVKLAGYTAVDWAAGEESTKHETFDAIEQSLVSQYLSQGGRLLVTGAEIGWDLDAKGNSMDRTFYRNRIGATYLSDDAGVYSFRGASGGIFGDIGSGMFDDGKQGSYNVDYPDVIRATDSKSKTCLQYGNGLVAGIQRVDGMSRVVHLGFPFETITSPSLRAQVMNRALRFLLADRLLDAPRDLVIGNSAPIEINDPTAAGQVFILAASLALHPVTPLPGGGYLPLAADGLFGASLTPGSQVFQGFQGMLDAQGRAQARLWLPNLSVLRGYRF